MALYLPPDVNRERLLGPLMVDDTTWNDAGWRRWVTPRHPLYFALIYCGQLLDPGRTGDQSLSWLHLDMARAAQRWAGRISRGGLAEVIRDYWVAPRNSGKTTWFQILLLWALCHRHVFYALQLGDNAERARQHLSEIRQLLDSSPWIVSDYPHMRPGRRDAGTQLTTLGGQSILAQGWEAKVLGTKEQSRRPDMIGIDDLEPGNESHTDGARERRLRALQGTILPLNESAIVQINQSVPHHGSLAHAVVRAVHNLDARPEDWITAGRWTCRHYPAIEVDENGRERSLWPQRGRNTGGWSLDWLQRERELSPAFYALNYDGRALPPGTAASWSRDLFVPAPPTWRVARRILAVDGAVSNKATSDQTGYAVASQALAAHPIETVVEYARGFRMSPDERRGHVIRLLTVSPDIVTVVVEQNQGGDLWSHLLRDLDRDPRWPAGRPAVKIDLVPAGPEAKEQRQALHLYRWQQGKIRPVGPLPEFEQQAERYPNVDHDDVLDAVDTADRWLTAHRV